MSQLYHWWEPWVQLEVAIVRGGRLAKRKGWWRGTDMFCEWFSEHFSYIMTLRIGRSETFGPTDQNTLIDSTLASTQVKNQQAAMVNGTRLLTCRGTRTINYAVRKCRRINKHLLTVNPRGIFPPLPRCEVSGSARLLSMKIFRHSAQKSNNFWPSSCFCSSVRRYFDCVISNFPSPWTVTRHTRRLVPPVFWRFNLGIGGKIEVEYRGQRRGSRLFLDPWANRTRTWVS